MAGPPPAPGPGPGPAPAPAPAYCTKMMHGKDTLLRCVADKVYRRQDKHAVVRVKLVHFLGQPANRHKIPQMPPERFPQYLKDLKTGNIQTGINEIPALCELFRIHIFVVRNPEEDLSPSFAKDDPAELYLLFNEDSMHFDILLPVDRINVLGFTQSLVYKTLYEDVFKMKNTDYAVNALTQGRHFLFKAKAEEDEAEDDCEWKHRGDLCAKELIDKRILPFEYSAVKGLNQNFYKNVSYDTWIETKERCDANLYENGVLTEGDKCLCTLSIVDLELLSGYIQEIDYRTGLCIVFIEQLGEKRKLDCRLIIPLNRITCDYADCLKKECYRRSLKNNVFKKSEKLEPVLFRNSKSNMNRKMTNPKYYYNSQTIYNSNRYQYDHIVRTDEKLNYTDDNNNVDVVYAQKDVKSILKEYTCIATDFQPPEMNIYFYPFVVENDPNAPSDQNVNDSVNNSRQNTPHYPAPSETSSVQSVSYSINPTETPPSHSGYPSLSTTPMPCIPMVAPGNIPPPFLPAAYMPPMFYPPSFAFPRPLTPPPGVNPMVQKSFNHNGSDLPFHDIPTLRFYFNLGIDAMQGPLPPGGPMLFNAPVNMPIPTAYQPQISPNQLAVEFQQSLSLDTPSSPGHVEQRNFNSPNNGRNTLPRTNGRQFDNSNRFNRGGYNGGRYKRNDNYDKGNYQNGQNYNRTPTYNNGTNPNMNNRVRSPRNGIRLNNTTTFRNSQDGKNSKESSAANTQNGTDLTTTNAHSSMVLYPSPHANVPFQYYRVPFCPMENHNGMMPYPPHVPYNPIANDDHSVPPPAIDNMSFNQPPNVYPYHVTPPQFPPTTSHGYPQNGFPHPPPDSSNGNGSAK